MIEFTVCEEMATAINGGTYTAPYAGFSTAEAAYVYDVKKESLPAAAAPKVYSTPMRLNNAFSQQSGLHDRSTFGDTWGLAVVLDCGGISLADNATIKNLMRFVSEMQIRIASYDTSPGFSMQWTGVIQNDPIFNRELLKTEQRFHNVTEFQFFHERTF